MAVSRVLDSMASKLCSMRVKRFSDNQNVVRILQVGSRRPHLQEQAVKVFETCISFQIKLEPVGYQGRNKNWLISLVVLWIMMIGKSTLSFFNVSTKYGGPIP